MFLLRRNAENTNSGEKGSKIAAALIVLSVEHGVKVIAHGGEINVFLSTAALVLASDALRTETDHHLLFFVVRMNRA